MMHACGCSSKVVVVVLSRPALGPSLNAAHSTADISLSLTFVKVPRFLF